jgi:hypothetical protein
VTANNNPKVHRFYSRPCDRTLTTYRAWIRAVARALNAIDDLTEFDIEKSWENFWSAGDDAGQSRNNNDRREFTPTTASTCQSEIDDWDREVAALQFEPLRHEIRFVAIIDWDKTGEENHDEP